MINSTSYEPTIRSPVSQKLGDENYFKWSFEMEMYLIREGMWDCCLYTEDEYEEFIEGDKSPLKPKTKKASLSSTSLSSTTEVSSGEVKRAMKEFRANDRKCRATIGCYVNEKYIDILKRNETAKGVWNALKEETGSSKSHYLINLKFQFYTCTMGDRESLSKFLDRVAMLNAKMRECGAPIDEKEVCYMVLCHLPEKYRAIQLNLMTREDLTIGLLRNQFLVTESGEKKEIKKQPGQVEGNSALVDNPKQKDTRTCFKCGTPGHIAKDCRASKQKIEKYKASKVKPTNDESKKFAKVSQTEAIALHTQVKEKGEMKDVKWYFDSGCNKHMTYQRSELRDCQPVKYKVNGPMEGIGDANTQGSINLRCKLEDTEATHVVLSEVLYVPNLKRKLISVSELCKKGVTVQMDKNKLTILDQHGAAIMLGRLNGFGLYELVEEAIVNNVDTLKIWHERLGHLSKENLIKTSKLVEDMQIGRAEDELNCDACAQGKMARKKFSKDAKKIPLPANLGDRIHTDICGQITPDTWSGNKYFVSFIDEATRKSWIYMMSTRDQVLDRYKEFSEMLLTQKNVKIKMLRCDGAGEYISDAFKQYLKEKGTIQEVTPPYTAQWNGIAERYNRTIMDKARCMLKTKAMDNRFWGEAVSTANFLKNRSPTKKLDQTPEEKYSNQKPTFKNFKVFGSRVQFKDNFPQKKKLANRSQEGVFVGYSEETKAFRIWTKGNKIALSRDVTFFEDQIYKLAEDEKVEEANLVFPNFEVGDRVLSQFKVGRRLEDHEGTVHDINNKDQTYHVIFNDGQEVLDMKEEELKGVTFAANVDCHVIEPQTWEEMLKSPQKEQWMEAIESEIQSLESMNTWSLVENRDRRAAIKSKWIFKVKYNALGAVERFKARLVAKGFTQTKGVDYEETFAPVVRHETLRYLISYATQRNLPMIHMDVETAFLNGELEEELFMEIPQGFKDAGRICKLEKSLYGLKQSPRTWNKKMTTTLQEENFIQSSADPCLFIKKIDDRLAFISCYVDDCLLIGKDQDVRNLKATLTSKFKMKDLGEVKSIIGLQVERKKDQTQIFQTHKILELLKKFDMQDCHGVDAPLPMKIEFNDVEKQPLNDATKYREAVGALNYLSVCTRPDISYAVSHVSKKMQNPTEGDWKLVKRILRFLKKTANARITYQVKPEVLVGYSDASYAPNHDDRKSVSGYVFKLNGAAVSWKSKKQPIVALSSMEAEYIALAAAVRESNWIDKLQTDLQVKGMSTIIFEDNQSTIKTSKNEIHSDRSKHIDVRYHYVREQVQKKAVEIQYCPTEDMIADIMTKALGSIKHAKFMQDLGLVI